MICTVLIEIPCLRLVDTFIVRGKGSFTSSFAQSIMNLTKSNKGNESSEGQSDSDKLIDDDNRRANLSPKTFHE